MRSSRADDPSLAVLLISPDGGASHAPAEAALDRVDKALQVLGYRVVRAPSTDEGLALVKSQPVFGAVVLDWDLGDGKRCSRDAALAIIHGVRARSRLMPVFLAVDAASPPALPLPVARDVHGYLRPLAETPETTAHRLDFAVRQYYAGLLPPYLRALGQQVDDGPSLWGGAGHQSGEAYRRHPVGAEFQRLFGEGLTRADVGMRVPELGDWLEHAGAPADSERRAARVFGADWSYFVLGGLSAANRIVVTGIAARDDVVLVDRSCHRSVVHGLIQSGARPVYLKPACNAYGMIGPVPPWCLAPGHIHELIDHSGLSRGAASLDPVLAVITNSTYDGLCCDVERVVATLGPVVPRLLFDEAAYGYAHMHPMYEGRHAMGVRIDPAECPTLFAVQSTHETLPALSMASMIHARPGARAPVNARAFHQAFLMHGTTSPFHPILASSDVATAMMEPPAGRTLLDEAIRDAIEFRQAMAATRARFLEGHGTDAWFFDVFQPTHVTYPSTTAAIPFAEASAALLATHPACWTLKPGESWHGFADLDVDGMHALVDPMKVTILCPGVDAEGVAAAQGVPALRPGAVSRRASNLCIALGCIHRAAAVFARAGPGALGRRHRGAPRVQAVLRRRRDRWRGAAPPRRGAAALRQPVAAHPVRQHARRHDRAGDRPPRPRGDARRSAPGDHARRGVPGSAARPDGRRAAPRRGGPDRRRHRGAGLAGHAARAAR